MSSMIILSVRTDNPEAEIGLYRDQKQLAHVSWQAHRKLAETIHERLKELLLSQKYSLRRVDGLVVYEGPGSFTGLRIGLSVANALSYSLSIPVVAATGQEWTRQGIDRLQQGETDKIVLPEYGSPVHITQPKK